MTLGQYEGVAQEFIVKGEMRKLICFLLLVTAFVSCKSYKPASGNPYYKPLKEFKGDTLAYFNYNFKEHKDFYVGKRFSVLFNDVENNPKVMFSPRYVKGLKKRIVEGSHIYIEPEKYRRAFETLSVEERGKNPRYYDGIYVYFDEYNTIDSEADMTCRKEKRAESKDDEEFSSKLADCIFDCVIKNVDVYHTDMIFPWEKKDKRRIDEVVIGKTWKRKMSSKFDKMEGMQSVRFDKDSVFFTNKESKTELSAAYYVTWRSRVVEGEFQEEKVGTWMLDENKIGNRLVIKTDSGIPDVYEVLEFTNNHVRMRSTATGQLMDFYPKM